MRKIVMATATALGVALSAGTAMATPVVLTFEGVGDQQSVGNYYNGGAGGNYGIAFGPDSLALINSDQGGTGNPRNEPSGDTCLIFLTGPGDVMNVAAGFDTGFSFFYAANGDAGTGSVNVWSGVDGTGTLLATLTLPGTPDPYNVWAAIGVTFAGSAESVVFSGAANYIAFDNITLGTATAGGSDVPEPASFALLGAGLLGAGGMMGWRRKQASKAA